jgi:HTH-type transcriptional regulator/antitoxin HipB
MRTRGKKPVQDSSPTGRLGTAVRARRRALRLDQAELSALAGVGLAFLYELEHGKPTVRLDKVLAVLDVLGLEFALKPGKERISVAASLGDDDA